jgi:DNA-binding LacI/PurR family transcriptional regulator
VPNYSARRLRGEGDAIGVMITDTLEDVPLERFTGEALYWFYHLSYDRGYKLNRVHLPSAEFNETRLYAALNDGALDGVIFLTPRLSQVEAIVRVMDRLNHLPHIFSARRWTCRRKVILTAMGNPAPLKSSGT